MMKERGMRQTVITSFFPSCVPLRLNADVLVHIMRFISSKGELFRMMKTCRSLYLAGLPMMLKNVHLWLDDRTCGLARFCRFMEFDLENRCPLVRNLSISLAFAYEMLECHQTNTMDRFSTVLEHCRNLHSLSLPDGELWLYYGPTSIPRALRALTSMRDLELTLVDDYDATLQLLSNLDLPNLQAISVQHDKDYLHNTDNRIIGNPFEILHNQRSTLEVIRFGPCLPESSSHIYPMAKTIVFSCLAIENINTSALMHSLPNLQRLSLGYLPPHQEDLDRLGRHGEEVLARVHLRNIVHQRDLHLWRQLDAVRGDVLALYALALTCPVRHVQIEESITPGLIPFWTKTLDACRPSAVTMQIDMERFGIKQLPSIISQTAAKGITHLLVDFECQDAAITMDDIMEDIYTLLHSMPLVFLDIHLHYWPDAEQTNPVRVYIHQLNLHTVATEIAKRVPTLQYLTLRRRMEANAFKDDEVSWEIHRNERGTYLAKQFIPYSADDFGMTDVY
ncbi:hypothetical protein K474DRAFT_43892 [Panus rudis PR-1116 ss-1]|nr:hypothetical protein K474DRAFT_43892 [Panus rudis PR-1116 ss-1]